MGKVRAWVESDKKNLTEKSLIETIGEYRKYDGYAKLTVQVTDKQQIIKEIGDLTDVRVLYNQILVGIWKRPEITAGGVYLTDNTRKEDDYQGKVGLVIKAGSAAFLDSEDMVFAEEDRAKVGDWVVFRPGDGWQLKVGERACRMLVDRSVKMIIPRPEMVY